MDQTSNVQKGDLRGVAESLSAALGRVTVEDTNAELQGSTVHTYPDGSQVVGRPPFPEKSPKEREADMKNGLADPVARMQVAPGRPQSGEADIVPSGLTEAAVVARAENQLAADVASGKDPHVVNPTSSSDKPELAGTDGLVGDAQEGGDLADPATRDAIAAQIEPAEGATDEQVEAATTQVAREVKGLVADDAPKASPAKKSAAKK